MEYSEITVEKITKDIYIAKTNLIHPMKVEITMRGSSHEDAVSKLIKMLKGE